jgi:hypothetical protein
MWCLLLGVNETLDTEVPAKSKNCRKRPYWALHPHLGKEVSHFVQAKKALRESRGIALLCFRPRHSKGVRGQHHAPAVFYSGTYCTGGWVGPRTGLDRCGKSRPTGIRSPDRPAHSYSLYRLSYTAHTLRKVLI